MRLSGATLQIIFQTEIDKLRITCVLAHASLPFDKNEVPPVPQHGFGYTMRSLVQLIWNFVLRLYAFIAIAVASGPVEPSEYSVG